MRVTFQRRDEETTLEFRQDLATVDFLVISHLPNGTRSTERFHEQPKALEFFKTLENNLLNDNWHRVDEGRPRSPKIQPIRREAAADDSGAAEVTTESGVQSGAYALERPLYCPHCRERIDSVYIVRLTRTQVPFTSTLPRGGRAVACSSCDGVLSIELSVI